MAASSKLIKQGPDFISTILKIDHRAAKEQQRFEAVAEFKEDLYNRYDFPVQKKLFQSLFHHK